MYLHPHDIDEATGRILKDISPLRDILSKEELRTCAIKIKGCDAYCYNIQLANKSIILLLHQKDRCVRYEVFKYLDIDTDTLSGDLGDVIEALSSLERYHIDNSPHLVVGGGSHGLENYMQYVVSETDNEMNTRIAEESKILEKSKNISNYRKSAIKNQIATSQGITKKLQEELEELEELEFGGGIMIKAIAVLSCGYGTDSYDPDTYECTHAAYCGLEKIEQNEDYWNDLFGDETSCNESIHSEFNMPWGFDSCRVTVFEDGSFKVEVL